VLPTARRSIVWEFWAGIHRGHYPQSVTAPSYTTARLQRFVLRFKLGSLGAFSMVLVASSLHLPSRRGLSYRLLGLDDPTRKGAPKVCLHSSKTLCTLSVNLS
jgi:hypothetical protein